MNSRRLMSNSSTPLGGGGTAALRHFGLANVAVDTVITVNTNSFRRLGGSLAHVLEL
jgi:hypothetical protein